MLSSHFRLTLTADIALMAASGNIVTDILEPNFQKELTP
jgi:hypothetical protein